MGESNTSEALKAARRQQVIWGYIEGVAVTGADIDPLVVTRGGGVVAIDSKWRTEVTADVQLLECLAASRDR